MIKPEEGRHVHYVPSEDNQGGRFDKGKPHAAIVVHVWSDRLVNLTVFDRNGVPVPKTSVRLEQPEDEANGGSDLCRWMPYTVQSERNRAAAAA